MAKTRIFLEDYTSVAPGALFTTSTQSAIPGASHGRVRVNGPRKSSDTSLQSLGRSLDLLAGLFSPGSNYNVTSSDQPAGAHAAQTGCQTSGWCYISAVNIQNTANKIQIGSATLSNGSAYVKIMVDHAFTVSCLANGTPDITNISTPVTMTPNTWIWLSMAVVPTPATYSGYSVRCHYMLPGGSIQSLAQFDYSNTQDPGGFTTIGFFTQNQSGQDNIVMKIGCIEMASIATTADVAYPVNIVQPVIQPTTFYFDPTQPDDTGDGLTPATALKSITAFNEMSANLGFIKVPDPAKLAPTGIVQVNGIATVTVANSYAPGQTVVMWAWDQDEYLGAFTILSASSTAFTIAVNPNAVSPATGVGYVSATGNGDTVIINTGKAPMPLPQAGMAVLTDGLWIKPAATETVINFQPEVIIPNVNFVLLDTDGSAHTLTKTYTAPYSQLYGFMFSNDVPMIPVSGTALGSAGIATGGLTIGQYIDANPGTFWCNGTNAYVHPFDSAAPASGTTKFGVTQLFGGTSDASTNMNAVKMACRNWRLTGAKIHKTILNNPAADGAYCISDFQGVGGVCLFENGNLKFGSKHAQGWVCDQTNTVIVMQNCVAEQCNPGNATGSSVLVTQVQNGTGNYHYYINVKIPNVAYASGTLTGNTSIFGGAGYAQVFTSHGGTNSLAELAMINITSSNGQIFDQGIAVKWRFNNVTATWISASATSVTMRSCKLLMYAPSLVAPGGAHIYDTLIVPGNGSTTGDGSGAVPYSGSMVFDGCTFDLRNRAGFGNNFMYSKSGGSALTLSLQNCVVITGGVELVSGMVGGDSYAGNFNIFESGSNPVIVLNGSGLTFAQMVTAGYEGSGSVNPSTLTLDVNEKWTATPPITRSRGPRNDLTGVISSLRATPGAYEYGASSTGAVATSYNVLVSQNFGLSDAPVGGVEPCLLLISLPQGTIPPVGLVITLTPNMVGVSLAQVGGSSATAGQPLQVTFPTGSSIIQVNATATNTASVTQQFLVTPTNNMGLTDTGVLTVDFAAFVSGADGVWTSGDRAFVLNSLNRMATSTRYLLLKNLSLTTQTSASLMANLQNANNAIRSGSDGSTWTQLDRQNVLNSIENISRTLFFGRLSKMGFVATTQDSADLMNVLG